MSTLVEWTGLGERRQFHHVGRIRGTEFDDLRVGAGVRERDTGTFVNHFRHRGACDKTPAWMGLVGLLQK